VTDLPVLDAPARAQSERLVAVIRDEIAAAGGWIPFHRYMELALYAPGLGYYSGGARKFGVGGDFVTAPEITPLFGQALAAQVADVLRASSPEVIEIGAGSGLLAIDLLLELERLGCAPRRYGILEVSPDLRARQRENIFERIPALAPRVQWLDALPETFSGVVVANEVLDAMPLHALAWRNGEIYERGVVASSGMTAHPFRWSNRPACDAVLAAAQKLPLSAPLDTPDDEYLTEINLAAAAWIGLWGKILQRGALLLIDYGYPRAEYYLPARSRGTLNCHFRQRVHDDPFQWPGLMDITASVDFTAMAEAGYDAGLDVLGYVSQGRFLMNCGILECLARRELQSNARYLRAVRAVERLTSPREMGETFKVLALGKNISMPLVGFASGDRTHTL
jgi:SAM-dependent MidA family methyltransferase